MTPTGDLFGHLPPPDTTPDAAREASFLAHVSGPSETPSKLLKGPRRFTPSERDAAIVAAMPVIRDRVLTLAGKQATRHDIDDLLGIAYVAACECADRFEPGGRAKFETYVVAFLKKRIRGQWANARARRMRTANGCDLGEIVAAAGDGDGGVAGDGDWDAAWDRWVALLSAVPVEADYVALAAFRGPVMQEIVALSVFERLTPGQIALRTGLAVKDVRLSLLQAVKVLTAAKEKRRAGLFERSTEQERAA